MLLGSTALEVAIGLALLYALLSLIATSARELIETVLQTRAINLERGIREILNDPDGTLAAKLYGHPYISSLFRGSYDAATNLTTANWFRRAWGWVSSWIFGARDPWQRIKFRSNLPAYIPARNFAIALLDSAARGNPSDTEKPLQPMTFEGLQAGILKLDSPQLRRALLLALEDANGDIDKARQNVEKWFNSSMDRVSGWYRKQTQWILLFLGLVIAVGMNVDTVRIASSLYHDDAFRSLTVNQAERVSDQLNSGDADATVKALGCTGAPANADSAQRALARTECARDQINALGYPIGWDGSKFHWSAIVGWILTALALSLGAPFWFDLLNKMMVVRSTVKPDEKSPVEASKDRQAPGPAPQS